MRRKLLIAFAAGVGVLLTAAAADLPGLATQPFYTKGEPREAVVVWEMAHGGGVVLPLRNGTEIPSKPPMFHWLALAASNALGGVTELSTRLPSALLAILASIAVFAFAASIGRIRSGWLAALALTLSFEWLRAARTARVDMTVTFFIFTALLCFAVIDRSGTSPLRLAILYLSMAAATLAKGPVGFVLPIAVILVYAATHRHEELSAAPWREKIAARVQDVTATVRSLGMVKGVTVVIVLAAAWYLAASLSGGTEFLVKHGLKENLLRVIDPERLDTGHRHGPFYLIGYFFLGALPWSLVAPAIGWWLWRARPLDRTVRYLVVWLLTVVVLFSIPASKRSVYLLPAYPAAALLFGLVLGPGPEGERPRRLAAAGWITGAFAVGLIGLVAVIAASGLPIESLIGPMLSGKDRQGMDAVLIALRSRALYTGLAGLLVIACAAAGALWAAHAHWLRASFPLAIGLLAMVALIARPVEYALSESRTFKPFMEAVVAKTDGEPLTFYRAFDYGVVFYSGSHVGAFDGPIDASSPRHLLMWEDDAERQADRVDVLLRSEGRGPKGKTRMVLATPRGAAVDAARAGNGTNVEEGAMR